jgi:hypothetical protein
VATEWAVRPAILTTTTIGGGRRMRKNASLPAHTFDQAEMPTGSGRGAPSRNRARPPNGHATDLHTLPCHRLRGDGGGLRSARGSIAATGARFTPGQSAREVSRSRSPSACPACTYRIAAAPHPVKSGLS